MSRHLGDSCFPATFYRTGEDSDVNGCLAAAGNSLKQNRKGHKTGFSSQRSLVVFFSPAIFDIVIWRVGKCMVCCVCVCVVLCVCAKKKRKSCLREESGTCAQRDSGRWCHRWYDSPPAVFLYQIFRHAGSESVKKEEYHHLIWWNTHTNRLKNFIKMDILPSGNIFRELQVVHDTGYLSAQTSLEDHWEQVNYSPISFSPSVCLVSPLRTFCRVNASD